ncbi:MFS transporter [Pelagibacterium xiamenense]|uniref:MFS transporter n=1 Tax=Pelagibacterium xiamenense TaxID=2901140 RepID=UPI001E41D897|nr:MFS transporter [Pelagibacterium xiamenense]MCD7060055.1 MFS transporter [Pelagibacterium xiamenense]
MTFAMPARFASPEMRTALFYFSMFMTPATATLLLPIWLDSRGISEAEIGVINAAPIFLMIVLNLVVGRIADKANDWRSVIIVLSVAAAVVPFGLFFVTDFWGSLIVWTLCMVPFLSLEPVIDAAATRMTRRRGSDFARVRIWGSIGFIALTAIAGFVYGWLGIVVFVPLVVIVSLLRGVVSLQLPFFRAPAGEEATVAQTVNTDAAATMRQVLKPWFMLTMIGTAILQASHFVLMAFGALMWVRIGVPEASIGVIWAIGPACELLTMFFFARIARRFSARHLLLIACLAGVVRWTGVAFATEAWQIAILQTLHMVTFAVSYLGIVNFIANWTREEIAAQAQSFYVVLRQAANVVALVSFGPLVAAFGLRAFLAAAAAAALGAVLVGISLVIKETKR